jgi:hypothetical protein
MACYNTSCIIHDFIDGYINTITSKYFCATDDQCDQKGASSRQIMYHYQDIPNTHTHTHYPAPKSQPKTYKEAFSFVYQLSTLSNEFPLKIALF